MVTSNLSLLFFFSLLFILEIRSNGKKRNWDPYCNGAEFPCPQDYFLLGQGFDVLEMDFVGNELVNLTFPGIQSETVPTLGSFSLPYPMQLSTSNVPSSLFSSQYSSSSDYVANVAQDLGIEYTPGFFIGSSLLQTTVSSFKYLAIVEVEQTQGIYYLDIPTSPSVNYPFTSEFLADLNALPRSYFNSTLQYQRFIQNWGTHVVWKCIFGTQVQIYKSTLQCLNSLSISTDLSIAYKSFSGQLSINITNSQKQELTESSFQTIGGNQKLCSSSTCNWQQLVKSVTTSNIGLIGKKMIPISSIIFDPTIAQNLIDATSDYLSKGTLIQFSCDSNDQTISRPLVIGLPLLFLLIVMFI